MKIFIFLSILIVNCFSSDIFYYKNSKKVFLTAYNSLSRASSSIDYYKNENGIILGVKDTILIKIKDALQIDSVLDGFDVVIDKKLSSNMYLIKVTNKSETIDISNKLSQKEEVVFAHPDFIKNRVYR